MMSVIRKRRTAAPVTSSPSARTSPPLLTNRVAPVSQTAEYALRAMTLVASTPSGRAITGLEISERADIPVHYVSKVLRRLVAAGLLSSQKGHRGGFCLTRPANLIRFADVLEAMDQSLTTGRCAFGWGSCNTNTPCPLHPAWKRLNEAFSSWAANTTLADVGGASLFGANSR